jgi:L,D-peptidoglycan transpeptidase YkuD (ErfK/YbiS/YcfS/YnhG family)
VRGPLTTLVALALWPAAAASAAPPVSPAGMSGLGGADRVIVVAANGTRDTRATARTYARDGAGWRVVRAAMPAYLGAGGLSDPARRHEGDGTTPMGAYGFVFGFGSQADPGLTGFAWRRLAPGSCWAGDQATYNRWVRRTPCGPRDENLWASARVAYRYAAVIDFNYRRPVFGRGSGIFLHAQTGRPTRGCVSLRERDLLAVLRWLRPGTRIVIGTVARLRASKG